MQFPHFPFEFRSLLPQWGSVPALAWHATERAFENKMFSRDIWDVMSGQRLGLEHWTELTVFAVSRLVPQDVARGKSSVHIEL